MLPRNITSERQMVKRVSQRFKLISSEESGAEQQRRVVSEYGASCHGWEAFLHRAASCRHRRGSILDDYDSLPRTVMALSRTILTVPTVMALSRTILPVPMANCD
jgi:hypothetical protein